MEILWEVHSGLDQEGPGNDESTLKALRLVRELPPEPAILDIGCGPGRQTVVLAQATKGRITAVDNHQKFLDYLQRRAEGAGVADRVTAVNQSMSDLNLGDQKFDLIWSEGAIYIIGFEKGLDYWRRFLKPGGHIAVTEAAWLIDNPPSEIYEFWNKCYPAITTITGNIEIIEKLGYDLVGQFTLPDSAWSEGYYGPMGKRIAELREKYRDDERALASLDLEALEIEMFRKYSASYGYVFFVMRQAG